MQESKRQVCCTVSLCGRVLSNVICRFATKSDVKGTGAESIGKARDARLGFGIWKWLSLR